MKKGRLIYCLVTAKTSRDGFTEFGFRGHLGGVKLSKIKGELQGRAPFIEGDNYIIGLRFEKIEGEVLYGRILSFRNTNNLEAIFNCS